MSAPSGPWNRLSPKQKGAILIALIAIIVAIVSIQGRESGLDLTNPGLTLPPATASSTTTTTTAPSTTTTTVTSTEVSVAAAERHSRRGLPAELVQPRRR